VFHPEREIALFEFRRDVAQRGGQRLDRRKVVAEVVEKAPDVSARVEPAQFHSRDERTHHFDDLQFRVETAADVFDGDQRFEHHVQVGLERHMVLVEQQQQLFEDAGDADFFERQIDVLVDQVGGVAFEILAAAGEFPGDRHVKRPIDQERSFPRQHVVDHPHEIAALGEADPAHHAEIDEYQDVSFHDENIARVRVGMEEAEFENLFEQRIDTDSGQEFEVETGRLFRVCENFGHRFAVDSLHGEHFFSGEILNQLRNLHIGRVGHVLVEEQHVGRFGAVIELPVDGVGELGDDPGGLHPGEGFGIGLHLRGDVVHDLKIGADRLDDAGPPHLDHNLHTGFQLGGMNLPDAGGGHRFVVEFGVQLLGRLAEFGADRLLDHLRRKRRDVFGQLGQLVRIGFGDEVGAG